MRIRFEIESLDYEFLTYRGDIYDRGDSISVGRLDILFKGKIDVSIYMSAKEYERCEQEFSDLYEKAKADGEFAPATQNEYRKEEESA